jgi:hypothetical protein
MFSAQLLDSLLATLASSFDPAAPATTAHMSGSVTASDHVPPASTASLSTSTGSALFHVPLKATASIDMMLETYPASDAMSGASAGATAEGGTWSTAQEFLHASLAAEGAADEREALAQVLACVDAHNRKLCTAAFLRLRVMLTHAMCLVTDVESIQV